MFLHPNCKINLGLRVVRRRPDGYHDLETIFYPVYGLHDDLEITPSDEFLFEQEGIAVDCDMTDNLIVKCYRMIQSCYPQVGNVHIRFRKCIPFGAGLGGGSSDAAHTALALNELFHLGLTKPQLAALVRPLGADCPFFIYNTPCYAEGIGDILAPISLPLSGLRLVLIKPDIAVSTREAYAGITLHPEVTGNMAQALRNKRDLSEIFPLLINDFEQTIFPLHPTLQEIKTRLYDAGVVYASMSGSGSTMFGLFAADNAVDEPTYSQYGQVYIFTDMHKIPPKSIWHCNK